MEHLQVTLEKSKDSNVNAPQEVVEALVTLTKAGLLVWRTTDTGFASVEVGFGMYASDGVGGLENNGQPILDHDFDPSDEDAGGFRMRITKRQRSAILKAIEVEAKAAFGSRNPFLQGQMRQLVRKTAAGK